MSDMPIQNVAKIKEALEGQCATRPKFVRQKNTFGKVAAIVQEINSSAEWVIFLLYMAIPSSRFRFRPFYYATHVIKNKCFYYDRLRAILNAKSIAFLLQLTTKVCRTCVQKDITAHTRHKLLQIIPYMDLLRICKSAICNWIIWAIFIVWVIISVFTYALKCDILHKIVIYQCTYWKSTIYIQGVKFKWDWWQSVIRNFFNMQNFSISDRKNVKFAPHQVFYMQQKYFYLSNYVPN